MVSFGGLINEVQNSLIEGYDGSNQRTTLRVNSNGELVLESLPSGSSNIGRVDVDSLPTQLSSQFVSQDVSTTDYTVAESNISGAEEVTVSLTESSANNASATIEWTDGNGNVVFTETPASLTDLNNSSNFENLIKKSDYVKLTVSGLSTNVSGSIDAH